MPPNPVLKASTTSGPSLPGQGGLVSPPDDLQTISTLGRLAISGASQRPAETPTFGGGNSRLPPGLSGISGTPATQAGSFALSQGATGLEVNPFATTVGPLGFLGGAALSALLGNIFGGGVSPQQRADEANRLTRRNITNLRNTFGSQLPGGASFGGPDGVASGIGNSLAMLGQADRSLLIPELLAGINRPGFAGGGKSGGGSATGIPGQGGVSRSIATVLQSAGIRTPTRRRGEGRGGGR